MNDRKKGRASLFRRNQRAEVEALEGRELLSAGLQGYVWNDANGNRVHDIEENGIAGFTVYLDLNKNIQFDEGEPSCLSGDDGSYAISDVAPGEYRVLIVNPLNSGYVLSSPASGTQFNIDVVADPSIPASLVQKALNAADRWSHIIIGDLPDVGDIDDLRVHLIPADLGGNFVTTGGSYNFREKPYLPYEGAIFVDLNVITAEDDMDSSLTHAMGHVLGFGLSWPLRQLVDGEKYIGRYALSEYRSKSDPEAAFVPTTVTTATGPENHHWNTPWASTELMNLYSDSSSFISSVTVESMRDLGYKVNSLQADLELQTWLSKTTYHPMATDLIYASMGYKVAPTSGQTVEGLDFGLSTDLSVNDNYASWSVMKKATISGKCFIDAKMDQSATGDKPLAGRYVYIDDNNNGALDANERKAKTDALGNYQFKNIIPGRCIVRLKTTTSESISMPADGFWDITAANGKNYTGKKIAVAPAGSISGLCYADANVNGIPDAGEKAVAGRVFYIDANKNSKCDATEKTAVANKVGKYIFTGLKAGTYVVRSKTAMTSLRFSSPSAGGWSIKLGARSVTNASFGLTDTAVIYGKVRNYYTDGIPSTYPLSGLYVYVDGNSNNTWEYGEYVTSVDSAGDWSLNGFPAGTYEIRLYNYDSGWYCVSPLSSEFRVSTNPGQVINGIKFFVKPDGW